MILPRNERKNSRTFETSVKLAPTVCGLCAYVRLGLGLVLGLLCWLGLVLWLGSV